MDPFSTFRVCLLNSLIISFRFRWCLSNFEVSTYRDHYMPQCISMYGQCQRKECIYRVEVSMAGTFFSQNASRGGHTDYKLVQPVVSLYRYYYSKLATNECTTSLTRPQDPLYKLKSRLCGPKMDKKKPRRGFHSSQAPFTLVDHWVTTKWTTAGSIKVHRSAAELLASPTS